MNYSYQKFIVPSLFFSFTFCFLVDKGIAQIVPDATLPVNSTVRPQGNTNLIEGGSRAGGNLFHSFQEFSVPTGGTAFFNNALDIKNIFSRVTGRSISNIDGLIKANGTANLFLLNPNGIVFGPNARINIGGSFLATTANSFIFADGTQFSAKNPGSTPLLTVSVPIGLQYGGSTGNIVNKARVTASNGEVSGLQVQPGNTLALVGGNVNVDGGILQAPGGRVELGGIAGEGIVGLNIDGNSLSLSFTEGVERSDVSLTNGAFVDVVSGGNGSIAINVRNLNIASESFLTAGIGVEQGFDGSKAGNIDVNATGAITLTKSYIQNNVSLEAMGIGGDINIKAGSLSLTDAQLDAGTFGNGNAGNIRVQVDGAVALENSKIFSDVQENAIGNGGTIDIQVGSLTLTGGAQIITRTYRVGNAGNILVKAADRVTISGVVPTLNPDTGELTRFSSSGFFTGSEPTAIGQGGNIQVKAGSLQISDGAVLSAGSRNDFKGGDITIDVNTLEVTGGGQILTTAFGSGAAGSITVNASKSVTISGSDPTNSDRIDLLAEQFGDEKDVSNLIDTDGSFSSLQAESRDINGAGSGNIAIATKSFSLSNGAAITTSTSGEGNAGDISIQAQEIAIADSRIFSDTFGAGDAGNILLQADGSVNISNGYITSKGLGDEGVPGNIFINGNNQVSIVNSSISSQSNNNASEANVGFISILAPEGSVFLDKADLSTTNDGTGVPGNILISGRDQVSIVNKSSISSESNNNTPEANTGSISILALEGSVFLNEAKLSTTNFGTGVAGDIIINAREEVSIANRTNILSEGGLGLILIGESEDSKQSYSPRRVIIDNATLRSNNVPTPPENKNIDATQDTSDNQFDVDETTQVDGGFISIDAIDSISINSSRLEATTGRRGNAGVVGLITENGKISISNSVITSIVTKEAVGDAGGIVISTGTLSLSNQSILDAATKGEGDAGIVIISATNSVSLDGEKTAASSTVEPTAEGNGGGIYIATNLLSLTNSAQLVATNAGRNKAGDIQIVANSVRLDNQAAIKADTNGEQGNISVTSPSLTLRRGSSITTNAKGSNIVGGNISLDTEVITLLENSNIKANSKEFRGGRVIINTQGIFQSPDSQITATGAGGNPEFSGVVQINTPNVDPSAGLVELPKNPVDATKLVASSCRNKGSKSSQFIITGRGGLPPNPLEAISDEATWIDLRPRVAEQGSRGQVNNQSAETYPAQIVEAQGWVINSKGQVELVAKAPTATFQSPSFTPQECYEP